MPASGPKPETDRPVPRPRLAAAGPAPDLAGAILTIDLDAIVANWRLLQGRVGGVECAAVVKADAYGLGADRVAGQLKRNNHSVAVLHSNLAEDYPRYKEILAKHGLNETSAVLVFNEVSE